MFEVAALGRDERKGLGLRQDQLAAASGVGLRFIVELERGKPAVQLEKVLAVLQTPGLAIQIMRPDGRIIDGGTSTPSQRKHEHGIRYSRHTDRLVGRSDGRNARS